MPGVYREKQCPVCAIKHRRRGMFCSKSCSNRGRDEEYRAKMRDRMLHTEEGQERSWNLNFNDTDEPVAPQIYKETPTLKRNEFVAAGAVWSKVDD